MLGYPSGDQILRENQEVPVSQEELEAMEILHASVNSRLDLILTSVIAECFLYYYYICFMLTYMYILLSSSNEVSGSVHCFKKGYSLQCEERSL